MKSPAADITGILERAERDLLKIVAAAAAHADYETLNAANSAAQATRAVLNQFGANPKGHAGDVKTPRRKSSRETLGPRKSRGRHPRFSVRNGCLVKTGWSKKRGKEYTHKLPRATFELVTDVMSTLAKEGSGPKTAEQILAGAEKRSAAALPNYHVYTALACFCSAGLAEKVGREGYVCPEDLPDKAQQLWERLAASSLTTDPRAKA